MALLFSTLAVHLRYALIIVVLVILVILMSKWTGSKQSTMSVVHAASTSAREHADKLVQASTDIMTAVDQEPPSIDTLMQTAYADAYLAAVEIVAPGELRRLQVPGLRAKVQVAQHELLEKHVTA